MTLKTRPLVQRAEAAVGMRPAELIYTPRFSDFQFGPSHPMKPVRVSLTYEVIRASGLLELPQVSVSRPSAADDDTLALIHTRDYIEAVQATDSLHPVSRPLDYGLGTEDNPIFPKLYEVIATIVGASVLAADLVAEEKAEVAFNPAGGLHHAHRGRAAGFCVFNDPAIAIAHLLRRSGDGVKIAYVDIDAHHGDGVQEAFYDRPDVMTVSVHESGRYLFPATGEVEELGEGEGKGFSVNLPLAPHTGDKVYLQAFRETVIPLLRAFRPDFLITQLGADIHYLDPLTHLSLTSRGYLAVVEELKQVAQDTGRWIAVGGGGYDLAVVPRLWTLAFACMIGAEPPEFVPKTVAEHFPENSQGIRLHDTASPGIDRELAQQARRFAEKSVQQVKELIFPHHGL